MGNAMGSGRYRAGSPAGRFRGLKVACVLGAALVLVVLAPGVGHGAVTVSRAEVNGGDLRIEGTAAANRTITVDGVAMGTSDSTGRFKVERAGFAAPADCTVAVNDGAATAATATLSGCTVSAPPPSTTPSLAALTLSQTTVVGGTPVTGTVSLTSSAPAGGVVVSLSSNNTTAATVPGSVTVPAGSTAATFTVTTNSLANPQSSTIIGTSGEATRSATLTVTTQFQATNGSVSLARGGTGSGRVTSQPAGIDCTFTATETTGTCGNVFFPAGTQVRLEARPTQGSSFLGWEFETTCRDAPKVTVAAGVAHICRPVFRVK
jgi:hypothetical protein